MGLTDDYTLEQQRYVAAMLYPEAWAQAVAWKGERGRRRRQQLRHRAVRDLKLAPLRLAGASCTSCRFRTNGWECEVGSDFYGKSIVTHDYLCTDYEVRT